MSLAFRSVPPIANFTTPYRVTIRNTPRETTNANWHHGAYVNDSIQIKRVTAESWRAVGLLQLVLSRPVHPREPIPRLLLRGRAGADLRWPVSLPRTPFADTNFIARAVSGIRRYPALLAPRFGMSWDIAGNGKTVVKANWGRFHHNTGNASGDVNPLASATATFDWLDCRTRRHAGRLHRRPASATSCSRSTSSDRTAPWLASAARRRRIDPNLKDPYTDAMSFWFERDLGNNMGFRVGYTFRTDGNTTAGRAAGAPVQSLHAGAHVRRPRRRRHRRQRGRWSGLHVVGHPGPGAGEPHRDAHGGSDPRDRPRARPDVHQAHVEPLLAGHELLLQLGSRPWPSADTRTPSGSTT